MEKTKHIWGAVMYEDLFGSRVAEAISESMDERDSLERNGCVEYAFDDAEDEDNQSSSF